MSQTNGRLSERQKQGVQQYVEGSLLDESVDEIEELLDRSEEARELARDYSDYLYADILVNVEPEQLAAVGRRLEARLRREMSGPDWTEVLGVRGIDLLDWGSQALRSLAGSLQQAVEHLTPAVPAAAAAAASSEAEALSTVELHALQLQPDQSVAELDVDLASDWTWSEEGIKLLLELPAELAGRRAEVVYRLPAAGAPAQPERAPAVRLAATATEIPENSVLELECRWPIEHCPLPRFEPARLLVLIEPMA
jgi:hypothetical protein